MKIAISTSTFAKEDSSPLDVLRAQNINFVCNSLGRVLTAQESVALLHDCVGVIAGTENLSAEVLAALPSLRVISRCGVGLDSVDTTYAKEHNITVMTTSADMLAVAVAEYTLSLTLSLLRHTAWQDRIVRQGQWKKNMGSLLRGKKLGIVGLGRMGTAVATLFSALGCSIAFTDIRKEAALNSAGSLLPWQSMPLQDVLMWADILSLHCTAVPHAKPLLGAEELACMRAGTWLINTARGSLIDEEALYEALKSQHLAGAALDVFYKEPYAGKLTTLDTCILAPHTASYAREARAHMEMEAVQNLCAALQK